MSFATLIADAAASAAPAAGTAAKAAPQGAENPWITMVPFIVIIVLMFVFTMRSQKKQQQKYQSMLDKIVKGTKVVLKGGICGTVVEVAEKTYTVEIAPKTPIVVVKAGVACLADDEEAKAASAQQQ